MLLLIDPEKAPAIEAIARKWELPCVEIGEVTEEPVLTYLWRGGGGGDARPLACSQRARGTTYDWPRKEPPYRDAAGGL